MLSRLDIITQSLEDYVTSLLSDWSISDVVVVDTFPDAPADVFANTVISVTQANRSAPDFVEVGGPLVSQRTSFMIDIFAKREAIAVNLVGLLSENAFPERQMIPILDYTQTPPVESGDGVFVFNCVSDRNMIANPKAWQKHWHTVMVVLEDEYNAPVA